MELQHIGTILDHVTFPGGTLSVEERSAMEPALFLLQQGNKFTEIRFWGKIRGLERDYFLCQGTVDENGKTAPFDAEKVTFKSTNCTVWTPLPLVDDAMAAKCAAFNGYFTGDLSKVYGVQPEDGAPEPEDGAPPAEESVTEEKRLAAFVQAVDHACAVVPNGAYTLDARHRVVRSSTYAGLSHEAANCSNSFVHLRTPLQFDKRKVFDQKGLTQGTDFLDSIQEDQPEGCWNLRFDVSSSCSVLRNLQFCGLVAFAAVAPNPAFGYAYFGDGVRQDDLAFMLP